MKCQIGAALPLPLANSKVQCPSKPGLSNPRCCSGVLLQFRPILRGRVGSQHLEHSFRRFAGKGPLKQQQSSMDAACDGATAANPVLNDATRSFSSSLQLLERKEIPLPLQIPQAQGKEKRPSASSSPSDASLISRQPPCRPPAPQLHVAVEFPSMAIVSRTAVGLLDSAEARPAPIVQSSRHLSASTVHCQVRTVIHGEAFRDG